MKRYDLPSAEKFNNNNSISRAKLTYNGITTFKSFMLDLKKKIRYK